MAYLGNQPSNNFVSLKRQVITGNGGSTYTLDHSVASVNDVAIFVNNVRQDPASYSISGTALTLGGTISSSDSCYVIFLGQALQTVTPDADTITTAMLKSNAVDLTSKVTGTLPVANGGTALTSGFANGITMVDCFRLNANQSVSGNGTSLISNYERVDTFSPGFIGTGMTESGGVFTFPSTGIYKITTVMHFLASADSTFLRINHEISTDSGSSFDAQGEANTHAKSGQYVTGTQISTFDVTNTSTHQIRFQFRHNNSGNLQGATTSTRTGFYFERLGDT